MLPPDPLLRTGRLTIRPLTPGDPDDFAAVFADPESMAAYQRRASPALEGIARILPGRRRRRASTGHVRRAVSRTRGMRPADATGVVAIARDARSGVPRPVGGPPTVAPLRPAQFLCARVAVGSGSARTLPPTQAGRRIPDPFDRSCVSRKGKPGICAGRNDPAERATGAALGDRSRPRRPGAESPGHSPTTDQMSPIEMKNPVNSAISAIPP